MTCRTKLNSRPQTIVSVTFLLMLQLNEVMQETETDEPVKTAVIEFLDSLSLVINDQKLAPNYGVGKIFDALEGLLLGQILGSLLFGPKKSVKEVIT